MSVDTLPIAELESNQKKITEAVERYASLGFSTKDESVNTECVRVTAEDYEAMMDARGVVIGSKVWIENFNNVYQLFINALNSILIRSEDIPGMLVPEELKGELNSDLAAIGVVKNDLAICVKESSQYVMASNPELPDQLKTKFKKAFEALKTVIPKYLTDLDVAKAAQTK